MSVIVKGMKMPKCCNECIFCDCNFNDEQGNKVEDWMCLEKLKLCEKDMKENRPSWCALVEVKEHTEVNIFDKQEVHHNCTVEVWENSVTGEVSIGWYKNDDSK